MAQDKLFEMFFSIKDEITYHKNNTFSCDVIIAPKYGKIGIFVWYILNILKELCKSLIFKK